MKNNKAYGIAIIMAILLSSILLSVFLSSVRKHNDDFFNSLTAKSSNKLLNTAYIKHISEKNDRRNELLKSLKGSPLTADERYMEFQYGLSDYVESINYNLDGESNRKGMELYSVLTFYDSEMNSILKENTLLLVKREREEKADTALYYTYQDDSLADKMSELINEYGSNMDKVKFHVEDAYIKDLTFVPKKLSYTTPGENGGSSDEVLLISNADKEDELKKDGYKLFEIDNTFDLGESYFDHDEDVYVDYISCLSNEKKDRMADLLAEGQRIKTNDGEDVFFTKKPNPFAVERVSFQKYTSEENEDTFYVLAYEKSGIINEIVHYWILKKGGIVFTFLLIPAIIVIFITSLIIARTCIKKYQI